MRAFADLALWSELGLSEWYRHVVNCQHDETQALRRSRKVDHATISQTKTWIDCELAGSEFRDVRLKKRSCKLFEQLSEGTGEKIPLACQDWANTKAAYRFLSNPRVSEVDILAGHFQSTRNRFAATDATVLILHDMTEFNYHREDIQSVRVRRGQWRPS